MRRREELRITFEEKRRIVDLVLLFIKIDKQKKAFFSKTKERGPPRKQKAKMEEEGNYISIMLKAGWKFIQPVFLLIEYS